MCRLQGFFVVIGILTCFRSGEGDGTLCITTAVMDETVGAEALVQERVHVLLLGVPQVPLLQVYEQEPV